MVFNKRMLRNVVLTISLLTACGAYARSAPTAPYAFHDYCKVNVEDCTINYNEPEAFVMTEEIWTLINKINVKVNKQILDVSDMDKHGKNDVWEIPADNIGDCEDHVLAKRMLLKQAGLPHRAMRITVVLDTTGQGHAVLMIRTDEGDYILDNLVDHIAKVEDRKEYAFIKREDGNGYWIWMKHFLGM